jgi:hypothetical protein
MDAILAGLPCEILGSLIDRASEFVAGQVAQSMDWKVWKSKNKLTSNENDFLDVYAEAIVGLAKARKPRFLLNFYKEQGVIEALFRHWYEGDPALPFFPTLKPLARHFTLYKQLSQPESWVDPDSEKKKKSPFLKLPSGKPCGKAARQPLPKPIR